MSKEYEFIDLMDCLVTTTQPLYLTITNLMYDHNQPDTEISTSKEEAILKAYQNLYERCVKRKYDVVPEWDSTISDSNLRMITWFDSIPDDYDPYCKVFKIQGNHQIQQFYLCKT